MLTYIIHALIEQQKQDVLGAVDVQTNHEGIGDVQIVFSETKGQQSAAKGKESSKAGTGNKGVNVHDSPAL